MRVELLVREVASKPALLKLFRCRSTTVAVQPLLLLPPCSNCSSISHLPHYADLVLNLNIVLRSNWSRWTAWRNRSIAVRLVPNANIWRLTCLPVNVIAPRRIYAFLYLISHKFNVNIWCSNCSSILVHWSHQTHVQRNCGCWVNVQNQRIVEVSMQD